MTKKKLKKLFAEGVPPLRALSHRDSGGGAVGRLVYERRWVKSVGSSMTRPPGGLSGGCSI